MAIVLSNLIENAIHASEKQPKGQQAISLLTLYQATSSASSSRTATTAKSSSTTRACP